MPPFPRPEPFDYDPDDEIRALRTYRDTEPGRAIPRREAGRLLIASWNVANLGDQDQVRDDRDVRIIAEMMSWFDVVAIQEVKDSLSGLRAVLSHLPTSYKTLFTDKAGNNERMAFVFDTPKVTHIELTSEVAIPPAEHRHIKLPGITRKFNGFDRNPYAVAFRCESFRILLANVHLFFGSNSTGNRNRRALETFAVGRWADLRRKSPNAVTTDIIALGDFNMPLAVAGDPIFDALTRRGLHVPEHSAKIASTIASDNQYDQIAFFPGQTRDEFIQSSIFDFDGALFANLWALRTRDEFEAFMRFHISDHRLLWAQFRC